jgi:hypothetical protein
VYLAVPGLENDKEFWSGKMRGVPLERRDIFAFFRGTIVNKGGASYSKGIRIKMEAALRPHADVVFAEQGADCNRQCYRDSMRKAVFCLCPRGWSPWTLVRPTSLGAREGWTHQAGESAFLSIPSSSQNPPAAQRPTAIISCERVARRVYRGGCTPQQLSVGAGHLAPCHCCRTPTVSTSHLTGACEGGVPPRSAPIRR